MYILLIKFKERLLTYIRVCVGLGDKMYRKQHKLEQISLSFNYFLLKVSKYASSQQQQSF